MPNHVHCAEGKGKPVERQPRGAMLPVAWRAAQNNAFSYHVQDCDTWESVAKRFFVGVRELIYFNFMTDEPDEVNWYLHYFVGCKKVSPSGNNWMFSKSAHPGIIYIPPAEHDPIDGDPEEICVWVPDSVQKFMRRLFAIGQSISGEKGQNIRKLVKVMVRVGYPDCRDLWYYNYVPLSRYIDITTDNAERRKMTKASGGILPFRGDSDTHAQLACPGTCDWQKHPAADLLDDFGCGHWDEVKSKERLERFEEDIRKGWYAVASIVGKSGGAGGSLWGPMVADFIDHMHSLAEDDDHLYSIFQ